MSSRILLVGEEQPLWQELRTADTVDAWGIEFVPNAAKALSLMAHGDFKALVADAQLLDTSGVELLDQVMRRQPGCIRIILTEATDSASTLQCLGQAHRYILKPCDRATLFQALQQALDREEWLPNPAVPRLISQMRKVPSPPTIYFQISRELDNPDASVERVGELINQDPPLAAKVLQMANSAVFGRQLRVDQPSEAVAFLGLETTQALVLLAHTFMPFDTLPLGGFSVEFLRCHSILTGRFARRIARLEQAGREVSSQAFTAGLLHDLGKLLFAANMPDRFAAAFTLARDEYLVLWEAERDLFGASHAEIGAFLLSTWGLPAEVSQAVAFHHQPASPASDSLAPLALVHVANVLAHQAWPERFTSVGPQIDAAYLRALGREERLGLWRDDCLNPDPAAMAEA